MPASPHLDHYSARSYKGLDPPVHQEMPPALLNHEARYLKIAIKKNDPYQGRISGRGMTSIFCRLVHCSHTPPFAKTGDQTSL